MYITRYTKYIKFVLIVHSFSICSMTWKKHSCLRWALKMVLKVGTRTYAYLLVCLQHYTYFDNRLLQSCRQISLLTSLLSQPAWLSVTYQHYHIILYGHHHCRHHFLLLTIAIITGRLIKNDHHYFHQQYSYNWYEHSCLHHNHHHNCHHYPPLLHEFCAHQNTLAVFFFFLK